MITNMKIRHKLWMPALLTLAFMVPSCDLEIAEDDSLILEDESTVFQGVESVTGTIDNIYNNISGQSGDQGGLYALTEVTTDELLVPTRGTDWGDNGVWRTLHTHTWSSTHPYVVGVWNDKNSAVLRATEVIHPLSAATAAQVAEAKFLRAYNMWIVMDFWGQVPFREATDAVTEIPDVKTRTEAYDMIVQDLNDAIAGLPASNPTASNKSRAVKATARFLLAKVKLNANVYKGAYGANDLADVMALVTAIEAEGYAINAAGTYFKNFVGPDYPETDIIWNVPAGMGNRAWNGLHYNQAHKDNTGGGWNGFTTHAEFYDKFLGPTNDNSLGAGQEERRGYTQTAASTNATNAGFGYGFQFGQMYGWRYNVAAGGESPAPQPGDAAGHLVSLKTRTGEPLVFTKTLPGLVGNNEVTGIRVLKYSPADGAFTNGVVMARFSDAHLMRAEAMLRSGNAGGALIEVNKLRTSRTNTPALAGPLTEQMLLDERARELYTEGWRRNDLIRFGQYKGSWEFKSAEASADGHTDLFPIPSSALLSNPNLIQNPGY
jgi:starch-binding outer membrane protein, SusD/RagB family